jgi:hypothetical protein
MQRGAHGLLRFSVWRCVSLRAIPTPHWKRKRSALHRHLAALGPNERSAVDPVERFDRLLEVHPRYKLHALPWSGLYGRQHARALVAGLREILRSNWNTIGKFAFEKAGDGQSGTNTHSSSPGSFCPLMFFGFNSDQNHRIGSGKLHS